MSPNQIIPGQPYTLSYFITDHTDSNTYYVRAVVYDATTGEILDTQNLTRQTTNTRLFSKRAQAPGDSSGMGRKIVVVATPYTDSGYTTKSELYQEQSENYLIKNQTGVIGGGGFGTDYGKIREILKEEIAKGIKAIDFPDFPDIPAIPDMPFQSIFGAIGALQKSINDIPKDNTVNLEPVTKSLGTILEKIAEIDIPEAVDLSPVLEAIQELCNDMELNHSESKDMLDEKKAEIIQSFIDVLKKDSPKVQKLEELKKFLSDPSFKEVFGNDDREEEEPKKPTLDITKLL